MRVTGPRGRNRFLPAACHRDPLSGNVTSFVIHLQNPALHQTTLSLSEEQE